VPWESRVFLIEEWGEIPCNLEGNKKEAKEVHWVSEAKALVVNSTIPPFQNAYKGAGRNIGYWVWNFVNSTLGTHHTKMGAQNPIKNLGKLCVTSKTLDFCVTNVFHMVPNMFPMARISWVYFGKVYEYFCQP
jgi:hypothetical protein